MHIRFRRRGIVLIICATAILILAIAMPGRTPIFQFFRPDVPIDVRLQKSYILLQNSKFEDAIKQYRKALEEFPDNADIYYNLGVAFYELGNMVDAIEMFSRAGGLRNMDSGVHYNLGVSYGEIGMWKKAIREYKKAVEIDPNHNNAYYNLGIAYGRMDKWGKAKDIYKKLSQRQPEDMDAHYNLALLGIILDDKKLVVKEYKILKELAPNLAQEIANIIS